MLDRPRRLLAALAAALCLTACGGGGDGGAGPDPAATPTAWPQPVDGKLTEATCDVLTADDFLAVGVHALRWEEREPAPHLGPNAIGCHALGDHWASFILQPDPVSAELYFDYMLNTRTDTVPAETNDVPGADETWFTTAGLNSNLAVRKGSLIFNLSIGFARDDTDFDPRTATATLAGKILERLPGVGAITTGKPHEMVLTVTGKGTRQAQIIYTDPLGGEPVRETVNLPWTTRIKFPAFGQPLSTTLDASAGTVSMTALPSLTCAITIDGIEQPSTAGPGPSTSCRSSFAEPR
ncbi:hypothetical protein [Catenuloplanes atrovinosus]|uniref:Uncharacterized protein n=1 Tax=Catenuloplanes atrovinosus TaxID=137266 RepID=A0AAE3YPW3_9ACTN|nr:hypothetical protein [Catenuloplanes atrovinosus]MDR7277490.1 hypothetical protein [Catenuloplanes atrovinosus]